MNKFDGGLNYSGSTGFRLGNIALGTTKGAIMLPMYTYNIYNQYDSLAIHKGLERILGENNLDFRKRIINSGPYNSSTQGLTNLLTDIFEKPKIVINDKNIFKLVNSPLSYNDYLKLNTDIKYKSPIIIVDGKEFDFKQNFCIDFNIYEFNGVDENNVVVRYYEDAQKTVCEKYNTCVTIWKNDGNLSNLIEIHPAPKVFVSVKYLFYENEEIVEKIERKYEKRNNI